MNTELNQHLFQPKSLPFADRPTAAHLGMLAGRYALLEVLGIGGSATVYRAYDERLAREVAVKVLHRLTQPTDPLLRRFFEEARRVAALDSPHVVPVYDVGLDGGQPYLVMKRLQGLPMSDLLGPTRLLQPSQAVRIVDQLLLALDYLHQKDLIHRDIKPSNIMVLEDDSVVLLDLGISCSNQTLQGTVTEDGLVRGTPEYMAPERVMEQYADHRSDLYAAGVVLFEALAGRPPFTAGNLLGVCLEHLHQKPPSLRDLCPMLDPRLDDIVQRALAKLPADRYQSAVEMRFDLMSISLDHPFEMLRDDQDAPSALHRDLPDLDLSSLTPVEDWEGVDRAAKTQDWPKGALCNLPALVDDEDDDPYWTLSGPAYRPPVLRSVGFLALAMTGLMGLMGAGLKNPSVEDVGGPRRMITQAPLADLGAKSLPMDDLPTDFGDLPVATPVVSSGASDPARVEAPAPAPTTRVASARRAAPTRIAMPTEVIEQPMPDRTVRPAPSLPVAQSTAPLAMPERTDARSIRRLTEAVSARPNDALLYLPLADAYQATGNRTAAIAAYRRYLALAPDGPDASRATEALVSLR